MRSGPGAIGCNSNSCFAALSKLTVARTSCRQYSISSKSTRPLGFWSSLPGVPNSLHADLSEKDLLWSAQSRVRTSKNRPRGQSFARLPFDLRRDIGGRVEPMMDVLLLRALVTTRGKDSLGSFLPVSGLSHCCRMSDHPPFSAGFQSSASLLKSNGKLKPTISALA